MKFAPSLILLGGLLSNSLFAADTPAGSWTTVDDETGDIASLMEIRIEDDQLVGNIVELYNLEEESPLCQECEGERHLQPIIGMQILWGLRQISGKKKGDWSEGNILDPKNGKIYGAKVSLSKDGNELEVRGYLGISLFGRSQTWKRKI